MLYWTWNDQSSVQGSSIQQMSLVAEWVRQLKFISIDGWCCEFDSQCRQLYFWWLWNPSMSNLYRNARNVRFVLFKKKLAYVRHLRDSINSIVYNHLYLGKYFLSSRVPSHTSYVWLIYCLKEHLCVGGSKMGGCLRQTSQHHSLYGIVMMKA